MLDRRDKEGAVVGRVDENGSLAGGGMDSGRARGVGPGVGVGRGRRSRVVGELVGEVVGIIGDWVTGW